MTFLLHFHQNWPHIYILYMAPSLLQKMITRILEKGELICKTLPFSRRSTEKNNAVRVRFLYRSTKSGPGLHFVKSSSCFGFSSDDKLFVNLYIYSCKNPWSLLHNSLIILSARTSHKATLSCWCAVKYSLRPKKTSHPKNFRIK